jgi:hypothetical protein
LTVSFFFVPLSGSDLEFSYHGSYPTMLVEDEQSKWVTEKLIKNAGR